MNEFTTLFIKETKTHPKLPQLTDGMVFKEVQFRGDVFFGENVVVRPE